ncbi:MAG: alpha-L-fucosidase, partial [Eubacteriales bacterium]|nr:alpha-L-fucosidase [Eubacteriales bacterium]
MFDKEAYQKRIQWFAHDRFGMFIHWGLYAIPARGEWVRSTEQISIEDYEPFFREFNPTQFDAKKWARAAKEAGMKYAVLTAKHHDGFCLFDSKLTDYKVTNTPFGRDIVREFLDAFRAEGLKVGLYYSLLDWHHPDYPAYGDKNHPMRNNPAYAGQGEHFERYLEYLHGQVRELCTNYGKLDIMWYDFSYDDMRGEKWKATELVRMVRSLQPEILLDNRLEASGEGFGSLANGDPSEFSGDFVSPEQIIPPEGIRDANGEPVMWEACMTMNNNWGYCAADHDY